MASFDTQHHLVGKCCIKLDFLFPCLLERLDSLKVFNKINLRKMEEDEHSVSCPLRREHKLSAYWHLSVC